MGKKTKHKKSIADEVYDLIDEKTRYLQVGECCIALCDIIDKVKVLLEAKRIDYNRMRERNPNLY